METHSRIFKIKIKSVIEVEHNFDFPEFLLNLRKASGLSRKKMSENLKDCEGLNLTVSRINNLETGNFIGHPEETNALAAYYGVPKALMNLKLKDYLAERHLERSKFRRLRKSAEFLVNQSDQWDAI